MQHASPIRRSQRWLLGSLALVAAFLLQVSPAAAAPDFGFDFFDAPSLDESGQTETQAGAHPYSNTTRIYFKADEEGHSYEQIKNTGVQLPAGFLGNPTAAPRCPIRTFGLLFAACPLDTQVGVAAVDVGETTSSPLYNLETEEGVPAQFGFKYVGLPIILTAKIRPGDYSVDVASSNATETLTTNKVTIQFWGVPADPSHDKVRGPFECEGDITILGSQAAEECSPMDNPATVAPKPFLINPDDCSAGPLTTTVRGVSWADPTDVKTATAISPPITGCDQPPFSPKIDVAPTSNSADSPTGLDVVLNVPQNEDPYGLAAARLKEASVTLPQGIAVNPASAAGLDACGPSQVGLTTAAGNPAARFDGSPVACPQGSRIGTVQVDTPVVDHPLPGSLYLAEQGNNPFNSLLALYLVVDDLQTGTRIKLAGRAEPDPGTGQLKAVFSENPQLPFENLKVSLFEGPRAPLRTAINCGTFTTTSTLTPWTAPEGAIASPSSSFEIQRGANGGACVGSEAQAPNNPAFNAGTVDPSAGDYSPFVLKMTRQAGAQQIRSIDAAMPKGLLGKLAGIPYCSDAALSAASSRSGKAEQSSSSCPLASRLGSVTVGAGAGSLPLYVNGDAYLAGPYKGAPLSLAIITPAVAGPFDLGTVVVRTALQVNPETTQIRAVSDPIPTILQGIPLDLRSIAMKLDKPSFILNPTSCNPTTVLADSISPLGSTASLSSPFQVGGCGALPFKPKLTLDLKGGTKRGQYPALKATLTARPGDANIAKAVVSLPHSEFLAQEHIKTICTRVQFAANACPPGSVYGKATAWSPLLDQPLSGPVYLRSSNNKLPDLVVDLNGQIRVNLVGRIDSDRKGGIRNSFEVVPDAPVSKFVLQMQGAKKGLLINSRNLCKSTSKADVKMDGQNGKAWDFRPVLSNDCGKTKKKGKGKKRNGGKGKR